MGMGWDGGIGGRAFLLKKKGPPAPTQRKPALNIDGLPGISMFPSAEKRNRLDLFLFLFLFSAALALKPIKQ